MKTYKITKGNKQYVIKAKDNYSAVAKLHAVLKDQKQVAKFTKSNNGDIAEGFIMETNKGFTFTSPQNPKDDKDFSTQKLAEIHANKLGYIKDSKPIEDDRLSPMTYKKLKEMGYNSDKWQNLTQEEANKIIAKSNSASKPKTETPKQETKPESKPAFPRKNSTETINMPIDRIFKLSNAEYKKIEPKLIDTLKQKNPDIVSEINEVLNYNNQFKQQRKINKGLDNYDPEYDGLDYVELEDIADELIDNISEKHPEISDDDKDELYYSIGTNNFRRYYIETLYDYATKSDSKSSTTEHQK